MPLLSFFMVGLFNSFDSLCGLSVFVWSMLFIPSLFPKEKFFFLGSKTSLLVLSLFSFLNSIFEEMNQDLKNSGSLISFSGLFFFLFVMNFFSLLGYPFPTTAHIVLNLSMGVTLWTAGMLYGMTKNFKKVFSHFLPNNTPMALISFLILIELLSSIMRPFVLSIRLTANLFAGHLLMGLISGSKLSISVLVLSIPIQSLFLGLEVMVAFIQAYIFSLLSVSYFTEITN